MVKQKNSRSRQGRHPDNYVIIGGLVPPRKKAIAIITASILAGEGKMGVLDLLWRGVENIARTVGVLDSAGNVTERFRDVVAMTERTITENQTARRAKNAKSE